MLGSAFRDSLTSFSNHGQRSRRGHGSRGTRLNEQVFRQIYAWTGTGYMSKSLKVSHPDAPTSGVYFQFQKDNPEIWISVGPGSNLTKFDLLPAYAPPSTDRKSRPLYALYLVSPVGSNLGRWVIWNRKAENALLKERLSDGGLVDIRNKPTDQGFKLVFSRNKTADETKNATSQGVTKVLEELRVDISMISEDDVRRGDNAIQGFIQFDLHFKSNQTKVRTLWTFSGLC